MAAALVLVLQPSRQYLIQRFRGDEGCGQAQHVGVVVVAGQGSHGGRAAQGGADALPPVGRNAHAQTGKADEDRAVRPPVYHSLAGRVGKLGVVAGCFGIRADVLHREAPALEEVYRRLLQLHPLVV